MTETNARYPYSTSRKVREREIPVGLQPIFETKTEGKNNTKTYTKLPRIYLKDKLGYRLDTLTKFQNDIYQAEQNIRNHKEPMTSLEWRLPLAPLPARPDYSRTEPIFSKSRKGLQKHVHPHGTVKSTPAPAIPYTGNWAQRHTCADPHHATSSITGLLPYLGTEVEDVAFVAESLNHLPHIPSLSFVRQELLLQPKTYFQFARHVYFHNKYLSETDRREAVYHFPGFCSGCQRYCLCHGCERSTEPHYHLDGRHKHLDEENGRWPRYSRGQGHGHHGHRLSEMEQFIQDHGLTPEQMDAIEQQAQRLLRQKSLEERNANLLPRIPQTGTDIDTDTTKRQNASHDDNITEDEGIMTDRNSMAYTEDDDNQAPPGGRRSGHTLQDSENFDIDDRTSTQDSVHVDIRGGGDGMKPRYSRHGYSTDMEGDWEEINDDDARQIGGKGQRKLYRDHVRDSSSKTSHHTGLRGSSKDSYYSRHRTSDEENTSPSPSSKSSNSKRRGLYRGLYVRSKAKVIYGREKLRKKEKPAPAPFKIKHRQRRELKSRSPFSTERKYNIPQGKGFQLKKGERQVTEFKEFSRGEVNWKAPPKYEIRRNEKQTTKFWSSPKEKDQSKKSKKRGSRRLPTSPDSGLDSEKTSDKSSESKSKDTSTYGSQPKHEINVRIPQATNKDYSSSENSDAGEAPFNDDDLISLTSAEPDLELSLNEVIDVENLDECLQNLKEKKNKRKKRKRKPENKAEENRHEETQDLHTVLMKDAVGEDENTKTHELNDADIKEDKQKRKQKERRSRKKRTLKNINEGLNESENEFEATKSEDIKDDKIHAADTEEDEINTEDIKTHDLHDANTKEEKQKRKQRDRRSRKKTLVKNGHERNDESNKEFEATSTEDIKIRDLHNEDNKEDKQKIKQRERRDRHKKKKIKNIEEKKDDIGKEFRTLSENKEKNMLRGRIHEISSEQTQEFVINDRQEDESENANVDKNYIEIFDENSMPDESKKTTKTKGHVKEGDEYCFQNGDIDEVFLRSFGEDFHEEQKNDDKRAHCLRCTEDIVRQQEIVDSENQYSNVTENTVNEKVRKTRYVKEKEKKLQKGNRKRTNAVGGKNRKEHLHSHGKLTSHGKTVTENRNSVSPIDLEKLPSISSIARKILSGIDSESVGNAMTTNLNEHSLMGDISRYSSPLIKNDIMSTTEVDYVNLKRPDAAVMSHSKFVEKYESSDEESHFDRAMEEELRKSVQDEDIRKSLLKSFEEADALTDSNVDHAESTKTGDYLYGDQEEHRELDHDVAEQGARENEQNVLSTGNYSNLSMEAKTSDICVQSAVNNITLTIQPENGVSAEEGSPGLRERIQLPALYPKIRSKKTRMKYPRRVSHAKILHRLDEDGEPKSNEVTNELDDIQSFMSELPVNDVTNNNQSAVLEGNFQRTQSEENVSDNSENRRSKEKMLLSSNSLHTGGNKKETIQNTEDIGKNKSSEPSNARKEGTDDVSSGISANSYLKGTVQKHSGNDHGRSHDILQDDYRSTDYLYDNKQCVNDKADDISKTSRMQGQDQQYKSDNELQLRQLDADRIIQDGSNMKQEEFRKSHRDSMLHQMESVMSDNGLYLSKDRSDKSEHITSVSQGRLLTEVNKQTGNLNRKYEFQTDASHDTNQTLEKSRFDANQMQEVSNFAIPKNRSEEPSQRGYNDKDQHNHRAQTDEEEEKICKDETVDVPAEMPPTTSPDKQERISTPTSRQLSTPGDTSTNWQISDSRLTTPSEVMTRYNEVVTQLPQVMSPSLRDQHPYTIVDRPKKERVKKTKKEAKEVERKLSASPVRTPVPQEASEVEPVILEKSRENSASDVPSLPPLELPPLPELKEETKEVKTKDGNRTQIQTGPKLKPVRAPLPRKNVSKANLKTPLSKPKKRGKSAAEAPVTSEEMKEFQDPLDFLKQYCIIHQDRLPFYERIYTNIIECQSPRYEKERPLSPRTGMPMETIPEWGEHEMNMFHDMIVINRGHDPSRIGLTSAEQYLEKVCYTLEILSKKKDHICDDLEELDINRTKKIADRGRELVRDIHRPDYVKKEKKSKKKKKKKGMDSPVQLLRPDDITDAIIASRIEDKLLKTICKEPEIFQLEVEMQRCKEKLAEIDERIVQLDGEKNILGMYCMQVFFMEQNDNRKPLEFRRAQSALYTKLHPHLDLEMNMDELEGALQLINNNLLSDREFEYLFHILNLPGRRKINFQLFSIVAALSEKVTQMDPFIRKLINKMDYNALATKMDRSKDLFQLICDDESEPTPRGNATASNLALELMAGGLSPEHTKYVLSKFNREGTGYVDFLDFVMYIPLFIKIHERIVKDPLRLPMETC